MKIRILVLFVMVFALCSNVSAKEYTFGIVPQQSAKKLAQKWGPILNWLSEKAGVDIKFATARDIPTFEKRLAAGEYDFAYMNPYHFTVFNRSPGYVALARQANKSIQGILVVHKDSDLSTLSDLQNTTLAFPSPAAFAASLLPQAELKKNNIVYKPRYVSSHDSVYLNVAKGLAPAGGGVMRTFKNTDPAVRAQLRIFWKTSKYTPHAIASHPDVPVVDRRKVQNALIAMGKSEVGAELLRSIRFEGLQIADDDLWDDVRALNLTVLDD